MCNKSQSKHLLHFYFSNNITTMFVSFLSKWWNMLWHPKQLHVSMCCRVYWRQMSNWWVARKQNDKETLTLTLGQTWIKSGTTVTPLPCYQHLVALFPETHISFFVILRKTTLQVVPPSPQYFWNYIQGSENGLYVSYILSRTMYVVPMEWAWKVDSNHTKYLKSTKLDLWGRGLENNALTVFPI